MGRQIIWEPPECHHSGGFPEFSWVDFFSRILSEEKFPVGSQIICHWQTTRYLNVFLLKFIYSEKAVKFCKISTLLLSYVVPVKSKVEISQNFVAFSEYMNFTISPKSIFLSKKVFADFLWKKYYLWHLVICTAYFGFNHILR